MYERELKGLKEISQAAGNSPDLVQGGGGNTSAKLDDELMAIKASGFALNQVTDREGYVVVNYRNIRKYYEEVDLESGIDYEKDSTGFVSRNIVKLEGLKDLRPSVEAGFHSLLKKYVIHTHSVYANIICCTKNGKDLADKVFLDKGHDFIWIPYINPGFSLTLRIKEELGRHIGKTGKFPQVVLMENHGLIVTDDSYQDCIRLNEEVNNAIKDYFNIEGDYPEIKIDRVGENTYKSSTGCMLDYLKNENIEPDYFDRFVLYPDQLVYLGGNVSVNGTENKLNINTRTGEVVYKTNMREALAMEETLFAILYVINTIKKKNLELKTMSETEIAFIANWESEKYRKKIIKS
ncbi:MAG: class II aldolase/adducin family protein [Acetivibrionales bacterium]